MIRKAFRMVDVPSYLTTISCLKPHQKGESTDLGVFTFNFSCLFLTSFTFGGAFSPVMLHAEFLSLSFGKNNRRTL